MASASSRARSIGFSEMFSSARWRDKGSSAPGSSTLVMMISRAGRRAQRTRRRGVLSAYDVYFGWSPGYTTSRLGMQNAHAYRQSGQSADGHAPSTRRAFHRHKIPNMP